MMPTAMMFRPGRLRQHRHFILLTLRSVMVWSTLILLLLLTFSSIVMATGHGRRRSPFILNSKFLTPLSTTTTRKTPSSSLLSSCNKNLIFNIRGGRDVINDEEDSDEEDTYDDDDDYDGKEDEEEQTVIHLETVAEDISKKVVYWTTNISKITWSHVQKWSIWYYKSCKRAIKDGIDEFHLQLEEELSDDEEDNNQDDNSGDAISKLVVLCQIIPIRTYKIIKRMTISFWTKDGSNEYDSDDNIWEEDEEEVIHKDEDDDNSMKIVADSSQFFSRISKSFNNKFQKVDDDEEYDDYDDEDEEYDLDVEDVLEPEITTETSLGDLRDNKAPMKINNIQEVDGEKEGNEEKGKSLGVLKEVPMDKLKEIPTTATKDQNSKIVKTVLSHIAVAIVTIVAWEQTRDSFLGSSRGSKRKNRWEEEL